MTERPLLADLLADPSGVSSVAIEDIPALLATLALERDRHVSLERALLARLLISTSNHDGPDRLLTVDEAAERLSVTGDWLKRRSDLPFVVKLSAGVVRYSTHRLEQFIATHCNKQA